MTKKVEALTDAELDQANGGMIFVQIPGMGDDSVSTRSSLAAQSARTDSLNGKGNTAMTEEIEMVIERLERG